MYVETSEDLKAIKERITQAIKDQPGVLELLKAQPDYTPGPLVSVDEEGFLSAISRMKTGVVSSQTEKLSINAIHQMFKRQPRRHQYELRGSYVDEYERKLDQALEWTKHFEEYEGRPGRIKVQAETKREAYVLIVETTWWNELSKEKRKHETLILEELKRLLNRYHDEVSRSLKAIRSNLLGDPEILETINNDGDVEALISTKFPLLNNSYSRGMSRQLRRLLETS